MYPIDAGQGYSPRGDCAVTVPHRDSAVLCWKVHAKVHAKVQQKCTQVIG